MSKADAVSAYRDSIYDATQYDIDRRMGERTTPIFGGFWPSLQLLGNGLMRPFKVGGAWLFGYHGEEREFPKPPVMPEAFKGTSLENAFGESWKLKQEATKARVEGMEKLLNGDFSGWWQKSSVASYAEARDTHVAFPEDGMRQDAAAGGAGGGFVGALLSERGSSSSRSVSE